MQLAVLRSVSTRDARDTARPTTKAGRQGPKPNANTSSCAQSAGWPAVRHRRAAKRHARNRCLRRHSTLRGRSHAGLGVATVEVIQVNRPGAGLLAVLLMSVLFSACSDSSSQRAQDDSPRETRAASDEEVVEGPDSPDARLRHWGRRHQAVLVGFGAARSQWLSDLGTADDFAAAATACEKLADALVAVSEVEPPPDRRVDALVREVVRSVSEGTKECVEASRQEDASALERSGTTLRPGVTSFESLMAAVFPERADGRAERRD